MELERVRGAGALRRGGRAAAALALAGVLLAGAVPVANGALNTGYTGAFSVSATTITMGTPITVTQSATNLTASQVPFITVGIRRLGFTVTAVTKPRTGICRIAGSATCSSLLLAPYETQTYTLTLLPNAPGTYQLQGWTTQPTAGGGPGTLQTVTVTVH
jgi:hypothetical protein